MRIALISTCAVPVPPRTYGGTELVIAELAKELIHRGHDVTVFATGDSHPECELRSHFDEAIWPPDSMAELRHAAYAWRDILLDRSPFDVVHAHQPQALAFSLVCPTPTVLTLHHDRLDALAGYYRDFPAVEVVAISHRQAQLCPGMAVQHVVHHGLADDRYPMGEGDGGWLAFVGRFAPEKGPHVAIDVAIEAGASLRMGGQPHWEDYAYFEEEVRPRLERAGSLVTWRGEVSFGPKLEILCGAKATLFPIQWEEPFGLVMIESILVGTPVIALARGAAVEVIEDGITGFLAQDAVEMADCVRRVGTIDRARCRDRAKSRWSAPRMARDYERVYEHAIRAHREAQVRIRSSATPQDLALVASR
ncbi:MAG: glycosyltransferase family 4 protein [Polyangiaceae bacterium]